MAAAKGAVWGRALMALTVTALLSACEKDVILQGTRFPVRAPLDASVPTEKDPNPLPPPDQPQNRSVPIRLPGMVSNADWPQRGGSVTHGGPHGVLQAKPQLAWAADIGKGNSRRNRIDAAPVVAGGAVFTMDALAGVTATSLQGATLWRADLTASFDAGGGLSGGGLAADGARVYATTGYGETVAINTADGSILWRQRLQSPATGAPAVAGARVFVAGDDGTAWALDAASGRVLWSAQGASNINAFRFDAGAAPAVSGNVVVFPFSSGILLAADVATGKVLWNAAVSGRKLGRAYAQSGDVTGDPVITGGILYAGTEAGRTGAYSMAQGQRLWTAEEGALNPPLVAGGSVFTVNDDGRLVRLDARDGQTIWAVDLPYFTTAKIKKQMGIHASFGPVLAGGHVVVVSDDGWLRAFNPTDGSLAAQVAIPGGAATPVALAQGLLVVVSNKGQLLAFR